MLKSITGAVLNINQITAEIILGIPPITIQTKVHSIKHFLKVNNKPVQNDKYKEFLNTTYNQMTKEPKTIYSKYKDVFSFLDWKMARHPSHFNTNDCTIIRSKQYNQFTNLSVQSCTYTQNMIKLYTETVLWQRSLRNQFQLEGYPTPPKPSCEKMPIPRNTSREKEVQLMSLFYKNNLLNQSLYNLSRVPSPLCTYCHQEEETADHLLFRCEGIEEQLRIRAMKTYKDALNLSGRDPEPDSYIGLLSACKDEHFIKSCIDILHCVNIKVTVEL